MIRYRVIPLSPHRHVFRVTASLEAPDKAISWQLPAWVPGSYMIRDFARHVVNVSAMAADQPLVVSKLDKQTWQTAAAGTEVSIQIDVHARDESVRAAFLDNRYGFFDGASVFLQPIGHEDEPCEVEILPPEGADYTGWQLVSGLKAQTVDRQGFGCYIARNYAELIDCPVMMGELESDCFEVEGRQHRIVLRGRQQADMARLCRDVQAICTTHAHLFGEVPMADYTFLTRVTGNGFGGLEHRNSSSLACARRTLPRRNERPGVVRDDYRLLLGLFSHEYFHSWNVKRIRPAAFVPYDLSRESYTELLWAFEGITSYYDNLALVRSGVISVDSYLQLLAQDITRVARGRGRLRQTVTESSFDAWTRFYKQDANAPNAIVSYYVKGALVALALDLTLRQLTSSQKSLDDVMRLLWQRYGKTAFTDADTGVPEQGIQVIVEEVAGSSLENFFQKALYSTEDLDLAPMLEPLGVNLHWRVADNHADRGGKPATTQGESVHLGAVVARDPVGVKLRVLYEQGAAMQAGLAPGDLLVAIDGLRVSQANLNEVLAAYLPGDKVSLHAFRDDELIRVTTVLQPSEADFAWLEVAKNGLAQAGREWLHVDLP